MSFDWTSERVAELRRLYAEGHSNGQIARMMGAGTRNTICGKAHRLGIVKPARAVISREMSGIEVRVASRALPKPPPIAAPAEPSKSKPITVKGPTAHSLSLPLTHARGHLGCRWIVAGEGAASLFCCAPVIRGSYCAPHAAVGYEPRKADARSKDDKLAKWLKRVA